MALAGVPHFRRRTVVLAATAVVFLMAAASAGFLFAPARTIGGQVIDGSSGQPLAGAVVKASGQEYEVEADGSFSVPGLRVGSTMSVEARGYLPASKVVALEDRVRVALLPRVLEGVISDASTGKPVAGARLSTGSIAVQSDEQGKYRLVGLEPGAEVAALAEGFGRASLKYEGQPTADLALKPNVLTVKVVDQYTELPLEGVEITDGRTTARTDKRGQAQLKYLLEGAEVRISKEGFASASVTFSNNETVEVKLRPDTVVGIVRDDKGQPIAGAAVSDGNTTVNTDSGGAFKISGVSENSRLAISANGFERRLVDVGRQMNLEVELKPFAARGLYLTYYGVGNDDLASHVLHLADTSEINCVVIDIKGDRGWIAYRSSVPMVAEVGAQQQITMPDPKQFLTDLKKRGIYTIARIVVFKDNPLATARPDLAVINANTGRPWVDNEGLAWTDAMHEEVWDYNIALAVEAIEMGFDEVQFDYVRFPTDASSGNSLDSIQLSRPNNEKNRVAAITGFLEKASKAIHAKGGLISVDVFGYVLWRNDDMGIGQKLEEIAKHVDYISPMVYPNLFWHGLPMEGGAKYGNQQAGLYPYEIVYESLKTAVRRIGAAKLRPWLEYYDDYITGKSYTPADMEAQKRATYDNGIDGWLFWDPTNRFSKGGFEPEG